MSKIAAIRNDNKNIFENYSLTNPIVQREIHYAINFIPKGELSGQEWDTIAAHLNLTIDDAGSIELMMHKKDGQNGLFYAKIKGRHDGGMDGQLENNDVSHPKFVRNFPPLAQESAQFTMFAIRDDLFGEELDHCGYLVGVPLSGRTLTETEDFMRRTLYNYLPSRLRAAQQSFDVKLSKPYTMLRDERMPKLFSVRVGTSGKLVAAELGAAFKSKRVVMSGVTLQLIPSYDKALLANQAVGSVPLEQARRERTANDAEYRIRVTMPKVFGG